MKPKDEKTIEKELFLQMLKSIPPKSYLVCQRCNAAKIDAPEVIEFLSGYWDRNMDSDDEDLIESAENIESILSDILEWEPYDATPQELEEWYNENKSSFFGCKKHEDGFYQYFLYEDIIFYTTDQCGCYLSKKTELDSDYRVKVG